MNGRKLIMKQLKLQKLVLTNFKGIKEFELTANGDNIRIFGDNATGKTTLFDAFVWLLFDKDSTNKKDFEIKTLNNGEVIHRLDHEVEATFLVEGRELTLKKTYAEKWTKKRGSITDSFSGHTTDYSINGVPSKKKEYVDKVAFVVGEDIFKLLTSPSFFNEQLHWKDRRDLLLEIAGDVMDEDVIHSNKDLEKLLSVLNGNSIEDHKKIIVAKRKKINDAIKDIQPRIDELNRGLPDVSGLDKSGIEDKLVGFNNQIESKLSQINDIRNGSEVNNKRKEISEIGLQIANVKHEHANQGQEDLYKLKTRLQEEQSNLSNMQSDIRNQNYRKNNNEANIKELEERMKDLRDQWKEQNDQEFDHESNCSCPTCGQNLPEEQLEGVKGNFNRNKSQLLETIQTKGIEAKQKAESIKQENVTIDTEISKLNDQVAIKNSQITKLDRKIKGSQNDVKPITENASYNKLMQDRQAIEQQIKELQQSVVESVQQVQEEIQELKGKHNSLATDLSSLNESNRAKNRIAELEQSEKDLAAEFEKLEHELYLTEEFTKTKVNLLTEKINSKFKYARFNLFKTNVNGGIEEICETTFEGVPYSSGLNNAARINVGLDIIDTLSEHYGVQAPIFVDNAEAVTQLIDTDTQVISLVVSEPDKHLRVENKVKSEVA